ncbi:MAG: hypothetical protein CM15mP130_1010 [Verrucomicrobiota bacterium]|nr:MAG: hypothetical protein CM15mP130_1010 [Verrucomicrobiota bacterium]
MKKGECFCRIRNSPVVKSFLGGELFWDRGFWGRHLTAPHHGFTPVLPS